MGVLLKNLMADTAVVAVPFGDDTMTVEYRTHAFDQMAEDEMDRLRTDGKSAAFSVELAKRLIVSWDFKEDDDSPAPIPLTDEGLRHVPISVFSKIFEEIGKDRSPNPTTSTAS